MTLFFQSAKPDISRTEIPALCATKIRLSPQPEMLQAVKQHVMEWGLYQMLIALLVVSSFVNLMEFDKTRWVLPMEYRPNGTQKYGQSRGLGCVGVWGVREM